MYKVHAYELLRNLNYAGPALLMLHFAAISTFMFDVLAASFVFRESRSNEFFTRPDKRILLRFRLVLRLRHIRVNPVCPSYAIRPIRLSYTCLHLAISDVSHELGVQGLLTRNIEPLIGNCQPHLLAVDTV